MIVRKNVLFPSGRNPSSCRRSNERLRRAVGVQHDREMGRDEGEIREQEAGGAAFWAVVAAVGVALAAAGSLGYLRVSLELFAVTVTPELTGTVLFVIGLIMVAVFLIGEE